MANARKLFLASIFVSALLVTSCGGNSQNSYTSLEGNWHLAGGEAPSQYPLLTLAIGVSGNMVYGSGDVGVNCSSGDAAIGSSFTVTGQIASDGTFTLTNVPTNSAFPLNTIQVVIRGKVPAKGATTWAGNFTITNAATETTCTFDVSSNFAAVLYPPVNGTYAGTLTGRGFDSGITVATSITQGAFTPLPAPSSIPPSYYNPLSATITVTGSSCFTSGTTNSSLSSISGEHFTLIYAMDDGSTLHLSGWFSDPSELTVQPAIASVINGKCNGAFGSGTLNRQ